MKIAMTVKGMNALRQELDRLENVERPKIASQIGEARALGDLSENAEYHAARDTQGMIEARIRDIKSKIANANVVDVSKIAHNNVVVFGVTVEVENVASGEVKRYQLVGDEEANVEQGKISINAPIARALVGHKSGDAVSFTTPSGLAELEIIKVEYID